MNDTTVSLYKQYLETTGDKATAAALTLADTMQTVRDEQQASRSVPVNRPYTVPEIAKLLRVRHMKVLAWIHAGVLRAYNVAEKQTGRPTYRVNPEDFENFQLCRCVIPPSPRRRKVKSRFAVPDELPSLPKPQRERG